MLNLIRVIVCDFLFDISLISVIIFVALLGDNLLRIYSGSYYVFRAFIDSCTHGLIGLFSWFVVTLHKGSRHNKLEIIVCTILSSLIDLDHFFKARSIRLKDAINLHYGRPFLHCSTIPLLILVVNSLSVFIFRSRSNQIYCRFGWLLWTAFTSHHVRDANRRGLWFYPFGSTPPLSNTFYILTILILPYLTIFLMNNNINKYVLFTSNIINEDYNLIENASSTAKVSSQYSGIQIV